MTDYVRGLSPRTRASVTQPPSGDSDERPYELSPHLRRWRDAIRTTQTALRRRSSIAEDQTGDSVSRSHGEDASSDISNANTLNVPVEELVQIVVGQDSTKQTFVMDKQTLCRSSRFFNSILLGTWKEAEEGKVRLKNVEPSTFEQFTMFLSVPGRRPSANLAIVFDYDAIAKLYFFARRYLVNGLQDILVDLFRCRLQNVPKLLEKHTVDYIQEYSDEDSNLLRLMVHYTSMSLVPYIDRAKCGASTEWYKKGATNISKVLFSGGTRCPSAKQWQAYLTGPCRWHVHDGEVICEQEIAYGKRLRVAWEKARDQRARAEAKRKRSLSESTTLVRDARKRSNAQLARSAIQDLSTATDIRLQTPPPDDMESDPADSLAGSDDEGD